MTPPAWIQEKDQRGFRQAEAASFAMEAWLDEGFGQLMSKLESESLVENTLVVFLIDNGWANGFVSKGSPYEKGIRTPIVFSWKGKIAPGREVAELASYLDLMPTLLDYASVDRPVGLPGKSLRNAIEGRNNIEGRNDAARRELMGAIYPAYRSAGTSAAKDEAIALYARRDSMKYIYWLKDVKAAQNALQLRIKHLFIPFPVRRHGEEELYDLSVDPHEHVNLATEAKHRETRDELNSGLLRWWSGETR